MSAHPLQWLLPMCALACVDGSPNKGRQSEGPTDSGAPPAVCQVDGPARSPMRRLTPTELDRTLADLLDVHDAPAARILPPEAVGGFSNNVDVRTVGDDTADAYSRLATEVATTIAADPTAILTCPGLFEEFETGAEAEAGVAEAEYLQIYDDHVALWSPGTVTVSVTVPTTATYAVDARVRGTECGGERATWSIAIDGEAIRQVDSTDDWSWEGVERFLDAGEHTVTIGFGNDCYLPDIGEDSNLFVDAVRITATDLPTGEPEAFSACATTWLTDFLPRAFRHPIDDPTELDRLVALFDVAAAEWGVSDALRLVLEVVLQSPRFLYRVEDTALQAAPGEVVALDGHEMASRLSYFLWGTMPDAELFAAAQAGELDDLDGLLHHAERMLADPRADAVVDLFFAEWLELDHLDDVEKDLTVYPDWRDRYKASFREETVRFVREVWDHEGARFDTLLTASWTLADHGLADFYGYEGASAGWDRVERDPAHHAGLLTQGAFLAARARAYGSSPIHRGMFVRAQLLCTVIPGPDPSLEITVPDPDPDATTREVLEQHREDPVCASCHNLIDPPGIAFEHFDGIGRFRIHENGLPVDASVELTSTDVDRWLTSAADLGQALAHSEMVHDCFAQQWYRFAHGRRESDGDTCEIEAAADAFAEDSLDMKALVLATVASPAFRSAVGSP